MSCGSSFNSRARREIVVALETAKGNHAAFDILRASDRVSAATLGRADLVMDLRPEPTGEIHLMPYLFDGPTMSLFQRVKRAFDPDERINAGKLLPSDKVVVTLLKPGRHVPQ